MQYRTSDENGHPVDVWELCEINPTSAIADLYHWSTNYDTGTGPFSLFLDLIGWSDEELGLPIYAPTVRYADSQRGMGNLAGHSNDNWSQYLGCLELSLLAAALEEYAHDPPAAYDFTSVIMKAETGELLA